MGAIVQEIRKTEGQRPHECVAEGEGSQREGRLQGGAARGVQQGGAAMGVQKGGAAMGVQQGGAVGRCSGAQRGAEA